MKNKAGKGIEPISITDYVIALPLSYPAISPAADLNHRPPHYKCDALTTELAGQYGNGRLRSAYLSHAKRAIYQLIYIPI